MSLFPFRLVSEVGYDFCLWLFLDFSVYLLVICILNFEFYVFAIFILKCFVLLKARRKTSHNNSKRMSWNVLLFRYPLCLSKYEGKFKVSRPPILFYKWCYSSRCICTSTTDRGIQILTDDRGEFYTSLVEYKSLVQTYQPVIMQHHLNLFLAAGHRAPLMMLIIMEGNSK